ncbi:hypothetical protein Q9966_001227 [Columba livia]|nr:hypothetical protein Q9966_001227 [Columba livia]
MCNDRHYLHDAGKGALMRSYKTCFVLKMQQNPSLKLQRATWDSSLFVWFHEVFEQIATSLLTYYKSYVKATIARDSSPGTAAGSKQPGNTIKGKHRLCDLKDKRGGGDTKTQAAASVLQWGSCSQVWRAAQLKARAQSMPSLAVTDVRGAIGGEALMGFLQEKEFIVHESSSVLNFQSCGFLQISFPRAEMTQHVGDVEFMPGCSSGKSSRGNLKNQPLTPCAPVAVSPDGPKEQVRTWAKMSYGFLNSKYLQVQKRAWASWSKRNPRSSLTVPAVDDVVSMPQPSLGQEERLQLQLSTNCFLKKGSKSCLLALGRGVNSSGENS